MRPLSARNPRIASLARLVRKREERVAQRALVVEGPVLLVAAVEAGLVVRDVFVAEGAEARRPVAKALDALPPSVDPWSVPPHVIERVGDVATSQGVVAVVEPPPVTWPTPERSPFVLVLAELTDPGNVGTLVRAATAAGAGAVVVAGGVDPTSPKVVRASAGAVFAAQVVAAPSVIGALDRLRADGYRLAAAVVAGGEPHTEADLGVPVAVVLGSEAHGLGTEVRAMADVLVSIEMAGPTESLNVAMAGTLLAFEVLRRRTA